MLEDTRAWSLNHAGACFFLQTGNILLFRTTSVSLFFVSLFPAALFLLRVTNVVNTHIGLGDFFIGKSLKTCSHSISIFFVVRLQVSFEVKFISFVKCKSSRKM